MTQVIGICGLIGSGKGTAADYLIQHKNFEKLSFADKLKDGVAATFGWPRNLLEGDTEQSRQWRETPDEFWSNEFKKPITPRYVLQNVGTECMRNGFHNDIWTLLTKKRVLELAAHSVDVVLPDTRFSNEIAMIRQQGGEIWWVRRGELPEWWDCAIKTNEYAKQGFDVFYSNPHTKLNFMPQAYPDIHPSEWSWAMPEEEYDVIINNDSDLETLYQKVENFSTINQLT